MFETNTLHLFLHSFEFLSDQPDNNLVKNFEFEVGNYPPWLTSNMEHAVAWTRWTFACVVGAFQGPLFTNMAKPQKQWARIASCSAALPSHQSELAPGRWCVAKSGRNTPSTEISWTIFAYTCVVHSVPSCRRYKRWVDPCDEYIYRTHQQLVYFIFTG